MSFSWYDVLISVYLGFLLDCLVGDPQGFPHPVVIIGKLISLLEKILLHRKNPRIVQRLLGALLVIIVISITGGITFGIVFISYYFEGKYLGTKYISIAIMSVISAYCMAARSLYDAAMAVFRPLVRGKTEVARTQVGKIAGKVFRLLQRIQPEELLHAVVELMVAGDGHVVAHDVHDVDDGLALCHGADGLALDGVAVIDEQDVVVFGEILLDGVEARVAPALVDAAVHVACEEDEDVLIFSLGECALAAEADEQRREEADRENKGQCFFHVVSS